jgi:YgiT-type zinc finger domain-containing protein
MILANDEVRACEDCARISVRIGNELQSFPYGEGEDQTILTAEVPVWRCSSCGLAYTDEIAEELRHDAICRHLGRLTPRELRNLRMTYALSQQEWAAVTGFGVASVKRWETSNQIQNEAADRYIRLLVRRDIFERVAELQATATTELRPYAFRTKITEEMRMKSNVFVLRPKQQRD